MIRIKNRKRKLIQIFTSINYEVLLFIVVLLKEVITTHIFKIENLINGFSLMICLSLILKNLTFLMNALEENKNGETLIIIEDPP
jgi:hypothetical protein